MHTVANFIESKSKQLAYFVRAYLEHKILYDELDLFFWDTMEEWAQIKPGKQVPYGRNENVFWHLMHQIHYWPQVRLQNDIILRNELESCAGTLVGSGKHSIPVVCIGIRP